MSGRFHRGVTYTCNAPGCDAHAEGVEDPADAYNGEMTTHYIPPPGWEQTPGGSHFCPKHRAERLRRELADAERYIR